MPTLQAIFKLFDGYSTTVDKINRKTDEATNKILRASGSTDKFNRQLELTGTSANKASGGLGRLIGLTAALAAAKKGMSITDEFINTSSRLALINDGLQTQAELQDKIFAAANRSKGAYGSMASAVAKMGLMAKESFGSNDELIAFTELIQKGFKVGGASNEEQSSAMLQLTQAMSSGRLQGDEFRSIMENAPLIATAIAKYTGKSKGALKEMSKEGTITADIIKNAVFSMGNDINAKFATMPMTFADVWNKIKNSALQAFQPIIEKVSKLINTDGFQTFVNNSLIALNILGSVIGELIDFIVDNWDIVGPILSAIAIVGLGSIISKLWAMLVPLMANVAGWFMLNAPMIILIATILFVLQALASLGVTFQDVFGFIGGVLGVFVGFFANIFIFLWNIVASFINFLGNVFNNPIESIRTLFLDLAVEVLGFIEGMAKGIEDLINKIPGVKVNITSGITGLKDKLSAKSSSIKDEAGLVEYVKSKEFMDYSVAATKGSDIGKKAYNGISDALGKLTAPFKNTGDDSLTSKFSNTGPVNIKGSGKNGAVKVDMSDEDLKYLRDIAEREYINEFSTATLAPNITIQFGDVHEEADANKVAGRIKKILQEEIAMASEGVYE